MKKVSILRKMIDDGVASTERRMILKTRFKLVVNEYQVNLLTFQYCSLKLFL